METLNQAISWINELVWGPLMLVLILGTGLVLQVGLKAMPIRKIGFGFGMLFKGLKAPKRGEGEITPLTR